jgi:hypothetical protein
MSAPSFCRYYIHILDVCQVVCRSSTHSLRRSPLRTDGSKKDLPAADKIAAVLPRAAAPVSHAMTSFPKWE